MLFGNDLEISSLCTTRTADNAETANQHKNLRDVLNSLHKIIGFFEREYENVNLDAVYGLRIAQGKSANATNNLIDVALYFSVSKKFDWRGQNNSGLSHILLSPNNG